MSDIISDQQVRDSLQRGALFENLAIVEMMKHKLNSGERPDLYFYRENAGLEIDIVAPEADNIHLYEIKAGKTLQPSYSKNMNTFSEKLTLPAMSTVVYDGESFPPMAINIRDI